MSDDPAKPPRFPYVGALLCAACVGVAVWTWMRYSYRREAGGLPEHPVGRTVLLKMARIFRTMADFPRHRRASIPDSRPGSRGPEFRLFKGTDFGYWQVAGAADTSGEPGNDLFAVSQGTSERGYIVVYRPGGPRQGTTASYVGRLTWWQWNPDEPDGTLFIPVLDTTEGRWHAASISGLVVGAMGVFIFGLAVRHWLKKRRAWRKEAEGT